MLNEPKHGEQRIAADGFTETYIVDDLGMYSPRWVRDRSSKIAAASAVLIDAVMTLAIVFIALVVLYAVAISV